jgi:ankyrin repeat protein
VQRGYTVLFLAIEKGYWNLIDKLLTKEGVDVNAQDEVSHAFFVILYVLFHLTSNLIQRGYTALIMAAEKDYTLVVDMLLTKEGVDVNAHDEVSHELIVILYVLFHLTSNLIQRGYTALIMAAKNGHKEIVNTILEKGVDENRENNVRSHDNGGNFLFVINLIFYAVRR